VKHFNPGRLKVSGTKVRTPRGRGHELESLLNDEINHVGAFHKRQRHVHSKGLIGELMHLSHLTLNRVELT